MNSKDGLKQIFDHKDALRIVAQTFDPRSPFTMEVSSILYIILRIDDTYRLQFYVEFHTFLNKYFRNQSIY